MRVIDLELVDITQLEQLIRDHVNKPRVYAALATNKRRFDVLCSALDAVGDAETAIDAYANADESPLDCQEVGIFGGESV